MKIIDNTYLPKVTGNVEEKPVVDQPSELTQIIGAAIMGALALLGAWLMFGPK